MKDKIAYIIIGILVIVIIITITDRVSNPEAQTNTQVFENVIIRGKLSITDGDNTITLENRNDASNIVINSKGHTIMLSAKKDNAIVILSDDLTHKGKLLGLPKGISLFTSEDKNSKNSSSVIYLSDDNGKNLIGTD